MCSLPDPDPELGPEPEQSLFWTAASLLVTKTEANWLMSVGCARAASSSPLSSVPRAADSGRSRTSVASEPVHVYVYVQDVYVCERAAGQTLMQMQPSTEAVRDPGGVGGLAVTAGSGSPRSLGRGTVEQAHT